jgi:hypothetical protein
MSVSVVNFVSELKEVIEVLFAFGFMFVKGKWYERRSGRGRQDAFDVVQGVVV